MRSKELKIGPVTQKVLVLLLGGLALGLTASPTQQFRIIKIMRKDWEYINRRALYQAIRNLYKSKLIDAGDNPDGTTTIVLTQKGQTKALAYQINDIQIPVMKKWDKKWRLILFDIPEKYRKARNALARSLKNMGCYQLQKSVLIHPFECKDEVDFVVEFFALRPYVRFAILEHIDNELHLKTIFKLF